MTTKSDQWNSILKLRADDIKKQFGVYGHYYDYRLDGDIYPCRSMLDLVAHDIAPLNPSDLISMDVDAYCTMMNPGSSKASQSGYKPVCVDNVIEIATRRELVPAIPDNTQYQVLKVAIAMGWQHVRILNLSDLRDARSTQFMTKAKALRGTPNGDFHLLWSQSRKTDRATLLCPDKKPMLVGWGRNPELLPMIEMCYPLIEDWNPMGIQPDNNQLLFAHPSPMMQAKKDEWLVSILDQLTT